uniref:Metal transporter n=1 Tax=Ornithorhynchus anatinus TaxID=9258 RepID=F7FMI2_ORNAN
MAAGGLRWAFAWLCLGCAAGAGAGPRVLGFRLEEGEDGAAPVRAAPGSAFRLRLFGSGLANRSWPRVTLAPAGSGCAGGGAAPRLRAEEPRPRGAHSALLTVRVPAGGGAGGPHVLCSRDGAGWAEAADGEALTVEERERERERDWDWASALLALALLALAALGRGLQLSALLLEPAELQVLRDGGTEAERAAALRLQPLRRWGCCARCALLLLVSLAQAALAVLLYRLCGQRVAPAVLGAAGLLYLLGEVLPAAVSGRWGLALAPRALGLARLALLLTFPVALPVGKLLELALRPGRLRERVVELARGADPCGEEPGGAAALRRKTVADVLTPLDDCFMLDSAAVLDFGVLSAVMQSGYARIPVYEEERTNVVDVLYLKDLAFVDPDDRTPLSTIVRFYNHPLHFVFDDTKLDAVLEEFKRGKSHLAIVQKVNNEGEGDPFYEVMGLVTLEDVIEEIIKSEILDESDGYRETKVKKKQPLSLSLPMEPRKEEFSLFRGAEGENKVKISPQLLLATQRFLSREVDLFSPPRVSEKVLLHLLKHPSVNQEVKFDECNRLAAGHYLYQRNRPVNYFILILQGRVEVEIGKEGLKFENGAFTYYGVSALTAPSSVHQSPALSLRPGRHEPQVDPVESSPCSTYCPDYTVRALSDLQLVKVTRLQYLNALMASRAQNSPQSPESLDLRVVPSSQTQLLGSRDQKLGTAATPTALPINISLFGPLGNCS